MRTLSRMIGAVVMALVAGHSMADELSKPAMTARERAGYKLFDHNCAHCHGDDARGDEGPDLHGLTKSDKRLEKIIKEGVKGEMPAFGKKFSDRDVGALIAFLRTLKN